MALKGMKLQPDIFYLFLFAYLIIIIRDLFNFSDFFVIGLALRKIYF